MYVKSLFFIVCLSSLLLAGCAAPSVEDSGITVTVSPLRYATEAIAGDLYPVTTLTPDGASPETYQPTPQQLSALSESKMYIRIGTLGFERTQTEKIAENMPHLYCVEASQGIAAVLDGHGEHASDGGDPHVWTSPKNMKIIAQNICRALSRIDTAHVRMFNENLARFALRMDSIDHDIREKLSSVSSRTFLIYHPALAYYAKDFGLHQLSIEHDGKEPSAERLSKLIEKCRREKVKVIFIQKEYSDKTARTIAEEIQAKVVVINPLALNWEKEINTITNALCK